MLINNIAPPLLSSSLPLLPLARGCIEPSHWRAVASGLGNSQWTAAARAGAGWHRPLAPRAVGGSRKRAEGGGGAMGAVLGVCSLASWVSVGLHSHPNLPLHTPNLPSRLGERARPVAVPPLAARVGPGAGGALSPRGRGAGSRPRSRAEPSWSQPCPPGGAGPGRSGWLADRPALARPQGSPGR